MTDADSISKKRKDLKKSYEHWYPGHNLKEVLVLDLQKPVPEELQDVSYIQPIISAYNHYLSYFISNLLDLLVPRLPDIVAERICTLAQLIASPEKFPMTPLDTIYTIEDLEMENEDVMIIENVEDEVLEANQEEGKKEEDAPQQLVTGVWRLASNKHNWSTCPIGTLPWKQHNTKNVEEMETN